MNQMTFRFSDPETSRLGSEHVAPKASLLRDRVAQVALDSPQALTANEIAAKCVARFGGSHESYRKRVHEVEREGRIKSLGVVECSVTGKKAMAYMEVQNARNDD